MKHQTIARLTFCGLSCAFFVSSLCGMVFAQNGRMIDSETVSLSKEDLSQLDTIHPGIDEMLAKVELESFSYWSDGLKVKGFMARPKNPSKSCPCVIYNRGGNRDFGMLNPFRAALFLGPIASWDYVVVASNYRGNGGGEGKEEFGGKDINDVLNLFPLLESLPYADAARVGMIGWSRGGLMTCLAMTKTDRIKAAIVA